MTLRRRCLGRTGEDLVAAYLTERGYRVIERNHRSRLGELDLVAAEGDVLVFVEVKSSAAASRFNPKYALTPRKQRQLSLLALAYIKAHYARPIRARFDVVTVRQTDERPQIDLIRNAFELAYPFQ